MRMIDADELKKKLSDKDLITWTHEYGDAIPFDWAISAVDNAETVDFVINIKGLTAEEKQHFFNVWHNSSFKVINDSHQGDAISRAALKQSIRKSMNERYISWSKTVTVADIADLIFDVIDMAPNI